jgi:two-component sensor histidine kinase
MIESELDDLKRRLAEAEQTLHAIQRGDADAVIVHGAGRDEVFHLVGGAEPYRAFMEAMDLGAAALDEANVLLYANTALAALLQCSPEILQRDGLFAALGQPAATLVADVLHGADEARRSTQIAIATPGGRRHLVVNAAPLSLGFGVGRALTFTDITERVAAAAAEEAERVGRAIMASANEAVVLCDAEGRVTHANPAVLRILDASPVGLRLQDALPLSFAAGAGALATEDLVAVSLGGGSLRGLEATVLGEAKVRDLMVSATPLRHADGAVGGCLVSLIDLSERKALEKRQALLMRELDHRMKNMLMLVQSISSRTLATSRDLPDFKGRFMQRIEALAATQDLLARRAWEGLSIQDLVDVELAPFASLGARRVALDSLSVEVGREAAVALGLVFHELVTNAVKYGALSNDAGTVVIAAARVADGLEITWREQGGPPVAGPPKRHGFGQTVIARGLGHSASAPTQVEFRPEGVFCRMTLSPSALI